MHFHGALNINCSTVVFITDVCRFSQQVAYNNYVSVKLPNYLSPKLTLTLNSHLRQNVGLGDGLVGSFPETYNNNNVCLKSLYGLIVSWFSVCLLLQVALRYTEDKYQRKQLRYPLDRDSFGG